jgi:hypothetical protein
MKKTKCTPLTEIGEKAVIWYEPASWPASTRKPWGRKGGKKGVSSLADTIIEDLQGQEYDKVVRIGLQLFAFSVEWNELALRQIAVVRHPHYVVQVSMWHVADVCIYRYILNVRGAGYFLKSSEFLSCFKKVPDCNRTTLVSLCCRISVGVFVSVDNTVSVGTVFYVTSLCSLLFVSVMLHTRAPTRQILSRPLGRVRVDTYPEHICRVTQFRFGHNKTSFDLWYSDVL